MKRRTARLGMVELVRVLARQPTGTAPAGWPASASAGCSPRGVGWLAEFLGARLWRGVSPARRQKLPVCWHRGALRVPGRRDARLHCSASQLSDCVSRCASDAARLPHFLRTATVEPTLG